MPARTDPDPASPPIEHAELRAILSHLTHELGRPLTSLRAGFDLLLGDTKRPVSGDQRGHLQTMAHLCDELLDLTRSYLDYAGLVQGTRPLRLGTYSLGAILGEIDRQFAPGAAALRIAWSCRLEGPDGPVRTDASRCQQLFGNLAANALKYTPEGGKVEIVARRGEESWTVAILDDGPGIPPEALEHVFEPFFRLTRDERSGAEGNGLGLAICRELVEQLGGTVQLGPGADGGTRAVVSLPVEPTLMLAEAPP